MANFTRFSGGGDIIRTGTNAGNHFETVIVAQGAVGTLGTYENIRAVNTAMTPDTSNADYNPNFATTLYYIIA